MMAAAVAAVAAGAAALGRPAMAQEKNASLMQYDGPDRAQKILAAAKEEGAVTLYTSLAAGNLRALIDPFEKKYGIKVTVWRASTEKVLQRTLSEAAAGRYEVDLIHFGAPQLEALHREKILQPVKSPIFGELMPEALPAHREWAATILQVYVQAYNTKLIKKEDLPKSYRDLLDPKWKGKLGMNTDAWSWYATLLQSLGEEKGGKLFRDIVATNGISMRQGDSLLTNLVTAGDVPLVLTVYQHMPQKAKNGGAPIDWFALTPSIARANGIGIARHAPHPNAALLFYDYMLSATGAQQVFSSIGYVPTNTKLPPALPNLQIKLVDPVTVLDQVDRWNKSFDDTFIKHSNNSAMK
ncbi:MAG: Iron uptake protein [Herbaspirillum sp.]|nr:Iron uptake protein [Herbaspirillum sp.]